MDAIIKNKENFIEITQRLSDFGIKIGDDGKLIRLDGSRIKHYAAEKEWLHKLKAGECLPRGKFFRNKKPGKPLIIIDEFHLMWKK
ncbi:hypothetical protein L6706_004632 [Salmonella enterica]|nr:hypothetical protein [Salmonella enterica]EKZ3297830.1 hypothetical protein [Salmonella enterica]